MLPKQHLRKCAGRCRAASTFAKHTKWSGNHLDGQDRCPPWISAAIAEPSYGIAAISANCNFCQFSVHLRPSTLLLVHVGIFGSVWDTTESSQYSRPMNNRDDTAPLSDVGQLIWPLSLLPFSRLFRSETLMLSVVPSAGVSHAN